MPHSPPSPATARYALQLRLPDTAEPARIAGRLEHVLSGRCRDFSDASGLLACLAVDLRERGHDRGDDAARSHPHDHLTEAPMNAHQIQLVQSSFTRVQPIASQAAALFYDHLFTAAPALRPLFRGDMAQQGERLMGMIGRAVGLLDRPDVLMPVLRQLGARHVGYGVFEAHYAPVGAALLLTLEQGLGAAFTAETREAWAAVYAVVSGTMIAAAREAAVAA